jgi:hypothetical protein
METITTNEYLEIKNLLLQQQNLLLMLIPAKASISRLQELTGKSRQALRQYVYKHFEPEVDFWIESDKIVVSKETAIQIMARGAK